MTDLSPVNGLLNRKNIVKTALKEAAGKTGVGFDVLYNMAVRESSLNPAAQAATSSAAGLFQFIENTWLGTVKEFGAKHGMADFAKDIIDNGNGRYFVADKGRRKEILDGRFDPQKAAILAGELTNQNKRALEKGLDRAVDGAELYAAHFLGAGGATKILKAGDHIIAAQILPAAARANKPVFYDGDRPKTVREVIDGFRKSMNTALRDTKGAANGLQTGRDTKSAAVAPPIGRMPPSRVTAAHFTDFNPIAPQRVGRQTGELGETKLGSGSLERSAILTPRAVGGHSGHAFGTQSLALLILQVLDPGALRPENRTGMRHDVRGR